MRVLLFPQATEVIKLILSKLNEMGLQGKSTIPLARLELRILIVLSSKYGFMVHATKPCEYYLEEKQTSKSLQPYSPHFLSDPIV